MDDAPAPARNGRKSKAVPAPDASMAADIDNTAAKPGKNKTPAQSRLGRKAKAPAEVEAPAASLLEDDTEAVEAPVFAESPVPAGQAAEHDEPVPPSPGSQSSAEAEPAAHWDRATDAVRFNWPDIERTASQEGPNQAMAKLLVAARTEGATSRWPF